MANLPEGIGSDTPQADSMANSDLSLKTIRSKWMETGNDEEALSNYLNWQKRNPELSHIIQCNIQSLLVKLGRTNSVDESQAFAGWFQNLDQIRQQAQQLLKGCQEEQDEQRKALFSIADLLDNLCNFCIEAVTVIQKTGVLVSIYDELAYLQLNQDVKDAVALGHFETGHDHYVNWGKSQSRRSSTGEIVDTVLSETSNLSHSCSILAQALQPPPAAYNAIKTSLDQLKISMVTLYNYLVKIAPDSGTIFNKRLYTSLNKDIRSVATAVPTFDPESHFQSNGKHENRPHSMDHALIAIREKIQTCSLWVGDKVVVGSIHVKSVHDLIRPIFLESDPASQNLHNIDFTQFSLAVHVHVFYIDFLGELLHYLRRIPFPFDLLLTYSEEVIDAAMLLEILAQNQWLSSQYKVIPVPNRGRNLAPLATVLVDLLLQYKYIAHVHTKKSEHTKELRQWRSQILESLFHSKDSVRTIISLLQESTDLVIPTNQNFYIKDPSGWGDNKCKALEIVSAASYTLKTDAAFVAFPEGGMFWMNGSLMKRIAALQLKSSDFEAEPIGQDGSAAHALERLLGLLAGEDGKKICQVFTGESQSTNKCYENHLDFTGELKTIPPSERVRILALFLPQFHESFENNAWHGDGFTDWTNVKRSNPLFVHHYQQRFPHPDIGYYDVDEEGYFNATANLMRASGVEGLIFYHYWFNGTTILSQPAQFLLAHREIAIHWCFCWANENWTRAWDGNEDQVLMRQDYSRADALAFIEYLLPFFQDERYLKIANRPLLLVYRPSHNPLMSEYVEIWNQACQAAGLPSPYLLCTLTRGAVHPQHYGFDAGLERVFHDWTAGRISAINDSLEFYESFSGSVLDYNSAADYYMNLKPPEDFKFIRSIVPSWDNTPRYGQNAYLLHLSSPRKFSEWLGALILDARNRLENDERIIVVNAWNEWAESAYLEPDCRTGYAYLNSVARSQLGLSYDLTTEDLERRLPPLENALIACLDVPPHVLNHLACDQDVRVKFWRCLMCAYAENLSVSEEIFNQIPIDLRHRFNLFYSDPERHHPVVTIFFRRIEYLSPGSLQALVRMSLAYPGQMIAANSLQFSDAVIESCNEYAIDLEDCYAKLGVLATTAESFTGHSRVRICATALSIPSSYYFLENGWVPNLPVKVNTIIRIHAKGNLQLLAKALFSLYVMEASVDVQPILACQDFQDSDFLDALQGVIGKIPWTEACSPIVLHYQSSEAEPDCRARMLHEPLCHLTARYFAYLDHDDVLYPFAYSYLLQRLRITSKAITFGRVYVAKTNLSRNLIVQKRREFEYGFSHDQFLRLNHAPLHSFLLDAKQLNLDNLEFIPGMKYMEDYYLTLQLFQRENCDWQSLIISKYVGDYTYQVDSAAEGTLSLLSDKSRAALVASDAYIKCEEAIQAMRCRLASRQAAT